MKLSEPAPLSSGRIIEIVMYLIGQLQNRKELADIDTTKLSDKGFTETEISTAFSWLLDKEALTALQIENLDGPNAKRKTRSRTPDPFRPFHEIEQSLISKEGRGLLLQLRELGLLGDSEMEAIIDRIWYIGGHDVSVEVIREYAAAVIFDFNDSQRPGSRLMLSFADKVQ